jgi:hypothetical protein
VTSPANGHMLRPAIEARVKNLDRTPHHLSRVLCARRLMEIEMKALQTIVVAAIGVLAQAGVADAITECPTGGYGPEQYEIYIEPTSTAPMTFGAILKDIVSDSHHGHSPSEDPVRFAANTSVSLTSVVSPQHSDQQALPNMLAEGRN